MRQSQGSPDPTCHNIGQPYPRHIGLALAGRLSSPFRRDLRRRFCALRESFDFGEYRSSFCGYAARRRLPSTANTNQPSTFQTLASVWAIRWRNAGCSALRKGSVHLRKSLMNA